MTAAVVCTPLSVERVAMAGTLTGLTVQRVGMGGHRIRTTDLGQRPILVAGVGGGLAPGVASGDVVVATEVRRDGRSYPCASGPLLAAALRRTGAPVHLGPIAGHHGVAGGADRAVLAAAGALAVDMESAALAELAGGLPFAVLRVIVDTADQPLLAPGTPLRGVRALRTLRRTAPAVRDWAAAVGSREILLAAPRSFCAGVSRAVEIVERALQNYGAPVYVRRQIVHNAHVVRDLEQRGAVFVEELDQVPVGAHVVLAAHGVAAAVHEQARERQLSVVDATCPLVSKVHAEVRRYTGRGNTVLLIGHRDHEEVVGTVGQVRAGAAGSVVVVEDAEQAARVQVEDPERVAYAMQTTLAVDEAEQVAGVLQARFPTLHAPPGDDICYATSNRQQAVRAIAAGSDLVLVLGSTNSSNSRRLVEVAERAGTRAHLIDGADDVDLRWLAGVTRVGITAGASAPTHLVDDLVHCLSGLGPVTVRETQVVEENVRFALPREMS